MPGGKSSGPCCDTVQDLPHQVPRCILGTAAATLEWIFFPLPWSQQLPSFWIAYYAAVLGGPLHHRMLGGPFRTDATPSSSSSSLHNHPYPSARYPDPPGRSLARVCKKNPVGFSRELQQVTAKIKDGLGHVAQLADHLGSMKRSLREAVLGRGWWLGVHSRPFLLPRYIDPTTGSATLGSLETTLSSWRTTATSSRTLPAQHPSPSPLLLAPNASKSVYVHFRTSQEPEAVNFMVSASSLRRSHIYASVMHPMISGDVSILTPSINHFPNQGQLEHQNSGNPNAPESLLWAPLALPLASTLLFFMGQQTWLTSWGWDGTMLQLLYLTPEEGQRRVTVRNATVTLRLGLVRRLGQDHLCLRLCLGFASYYPERDGWPMLTMSRCIRRARDGPVGGWYTYGQARPILHNVAGI
ncbi:hypothetical protein BU15DRAFT_68248 [Melanogaster broomeanus]|nr:hypothetical protein BU15DRAFT_68248 [Melanogaster broomeanus]